MNVVEEWERGNPMKPRDIFGVIVRTIGLIVLIYDAFLIQVVILKASGIGVTTQQTTVVDGAVAALYLIAGCGLLFGAKHIERAAYGREKISN